jgi:ABC-type transport system involved in multi-copper enzyme maturation permease subunit
MRWTIASCVAAGAVGIGMMPLGAVSAYVGGVSLICTLVILNIMLVMTTIVQEKKDKVQLFMLSLPISTTQYTLAKLIANAVAFIGCWIVLTTAAIAVIDVSALPNGRVPFLLTVLAYLLLYYGVRRAVGLAADSTGWYAAVITFGNVSINLLIPLLLWMPSIASHLDGPVAIWTQDVVAILMVELVGAVVAIGAGLYLRCRRTDYV